MAAFSDEEQPPSPSRDEVNRRGEREKDRERERASKHQHRLRLIPSSPHWRPHFRTGPSGGGWVGMHASPSAAWDVDKTTTVKRRRARYLPLNLLAADLNAELINYRRPTRPSLTGGIQALATLSVCRQLLPISSVNESCKVGELIQYTVRDWRWTERLLFGSDDDDEVQDAHWEPAVNNSYVFSACLIITDVSFSNFYIQAQDFFYFLFYFKQTHNLPLPPSLHLATSSFFLFPCDLCDTEERPPPPLPQPFQLYLISGTQKPTGSRLRLSRGQTK